MKRAAGVQVPEQACLEGRGLLSVPFTLVLEEPEKSLPKEVAAQDFFPN